MYPTNPSFFSFCSLCLCCSECEAVIHSKSDTYVPSYIRILELSQEIKTWSEIEKTKFEYNMSDGFPYTPNIESNCTERSKIVLALLRTLHGNTIDFRRSYVPSAEAASTTDHWYQPRY